MLKNWAFSNFYSLKCKDFVNYNFLGGNLRIEQRFRITIYSAKSDQDL